MERLIRWGVVFLIAGCSAAAGIGYGCWELKMAQAIRLTATFDLAAADAHYAQTERVLGHAGFVPYVLNPALRELRDRRAELKYWQGDILSLMNESDTAEATRSPHGYFIHGNARYRSIANVKDKEAYIQGLESCVSDYELAIRNDGLHFDAAYNYEFLLRELQQAKQGKPTEQQKQQQQQKQQSQKQKDGKSDGQQPSPQGQPSPNGMQGSEQQQEGMEKMKVLVPIDPQEGKDKSDSGPGAGKNTTGKKKG